MPTRTMPPHARARTLGLLVCLACLLGAGCAPAPQIDADWHRRDLTQGLLAHWLAVAPTESGFMRTALDQQWQPRAQQPGHLTEQARLVYALAIGYELTQDTRYLAAARRGADFLLTRFRDSVHGGFFLRVAADGTVTLETAGQRVVKRLTSGAGSAAPLGAPGRISTVRRPASVEECNPFEQSVRQIGRSGAQDFSAGGAAETQR